MSTNNDILTPYVSIGLSRFCKYCGKPINKPNIFCTCNDSAALQAVCHQVMTLNIERIKLINSAPPAKFTAATQLVPITQQEPEPDEEEPTVNV